MAYYKELLNELESLASENPELANEVAGELFKNAGFMDGVLNAVKPVASKVLSAGKSVTFAPAAGKKVLASSPVVRNAAIGGAIGTAGSLLSQSSNPDGVSMGKALKTGALAAGATAGGTLGYQKAFSGTADQLVKTAYYELPEESEAGMSSEFSSFMDGLDNDESAGSYEEVDSIEANPEDIKYLVGRKREQALRKLKGLPDLPEEEDKVEEV